MFESKITLSKGKILVKLKNLGSGKDLEVKNPKDIGDILSQAMADTQFMSIKDPIDFLRNGIADFMLGGKGGSGKTIGLLALGDLEIEVQDGDTMEILFARGGIGLVEELKKHLEKHIVKGFHQIFDEMVGR